MKDQEPFAASVQQFVTAMKQYRSDADEQAFSDADPDTWLSAPTETEVQALPVCFEHEAVTEESGVTKCSRCGASAEEIIAEQEAQLEAAVALGTYPELDHGFDDGPDSERDEFARSYWDDPDAEDV